MINTDKKKVVSSAYFGGGCFWCLEAQFNLLTGVVSVVSGYAGGLKPHPTYESVCSGESGHAEIVRIDYDPEVISYKDLLHEFFAMHDPTTLNRQGHDVGTQYRSVIYYTTEEEMRLALLGVEEMQLQYLSKIVTEVTKLQEFFPAEAYHQSYYTTNPSNGYCQTVIRPKVEKLKTKLERA
jgi:peptide-methionine (S)-S-oxide reductase